MSHTPGPWAICQAQRDAGRTVIDAHGRSITFTPVFNGSAAPDLGTAAANARLIAAAPELLAALARIAEGSVMSGDFSHADTVVEYQRIARAALAKAAQ